MSHHVIPRAAGALLTGYAMVLSLFHHPIAVTYTSVAAILATTVLKNLSHRHTSTYKRVRHFAFITMFVSVGPVLVKECEKNPKRRLSTVASVISGIILGTAFFKNFK